MKGECGMCKSKKGRRPVEENCPMEDFPVYEPPKEVPEWARPKMNPIERAVREAVAKMEESAVEIIDCADEIKADVMRVVEYSQGVFAGFSDVAGSLPNRDDLRGAAGMTLTTYVEAEWYNFGDDDAFLEKAEAAVRRYITDVLPSNIKAEICGIKVVETGDAEPYDVGVMGSIPMVFAEYEVELRFTVHTHKSVEEVRGGRRSQAQARKRQEGQVQEQDQ